MGVLLGLGREQPLRAQANEESKEDLDEDRCQGANDAANPTNLAMHASSTLVSVLFVSGMDARRL